MLAVTTVTVIINNDHEPFMFITYIFLVPVVVVDVVQCPATNNEVEQV